MRRQVRQEVYPSREDSELLLSCIRPLKGKKFLDMGTGSGIIGMHAAKAGAIVTAVDISPEALKLAKETATVSCLKIKFLKSDLFGKVKGKFDFIAFNPPYVPSEGIKWADTDGGKKGRGVLDRFLLAFPKHLKAGGKCWFLQTSLNGKRKTEAMLTKAGLKWKITGRKKLFFEKLLVYEAEFKVKSKVKRV